MKNFWCLVLYGILVYSCTRSSESAEKSKVYLPDYQKHNGWKRSVSFEDEFGRGLNTKFVVYEYYIDNKLINSFNIKSLYGDSTKVNSIISRYYVNDKLIEYIDVWTPIDHGSRMVLSHTSIGGTLYDYDTLYLYYKDRSIKSKSYSINIDQNKVKKTYSAGQYFIDLKRIDTLPGVIPTEYYYIME